ncbi:MAG: hypothetical protein WCT20_02640 [Candidatus Babeliales bacterium]
MDVASTIYLEIAQSSVVAIIGTHPPVAIALSPYDVGDGRFYQPFNLAKQLQKLTAPFVGANPHVVVCYPALAGKSSDERSLVTLQIALMLSNLGWIIDLITDQSPAEKNGQRCSAMQKDYLAPFRPPVYQPIIPWVMGICFAVTVLGGCLGWYAVHLTSGLTQAKRAALSLQDTIKSLQDQDKQQAPLIKRQKAEVLFDTIATKSRTRNQLLTGFIADVVANIPNDCWIEKLEFTQQKQAHDSHAPARNVKDPKDKNKKKIRTTPFILEGKAHNEKNIAVFFSALLACDLVEHIELAAPREHHAKKMGNSPAYPFTIKGTLKAPVAV